MTITAGGQDVEVDGRPLTLVCHDGAQRLGYPGRFAVSAEESTHHAERLSREGWHRDTEPLVEYALGTGPSTGLSHYGRSAGEQHLVGLVDLSLKLDDMGVPLVWVQPESLLHPGVAARLGDVAAFFLHRAQYRIGVRVPGLTSVAGGPISAAEYVTTLY